MNVRRAALTASAAVIGAGVLGMGALAGVASANGRPGGTPAAGSFATCPTGTGTGTPSRAGAGAPAAEWSTAGSGSAGVGGSGVTGTGSGRGGNGAGAGPATPGAGLTAGSYEHGTLTAAQQQDLAFMVEEEKLAHDVYTTLATVYDVPVFSRIAASETQHLTVLRAVAASYGVAAPSTDAVGVFTDARLAAMYTDLVAEGRTSLTAATAVGQTIEKDDLARLAEVADGLAAPDLEHAYAQLARASEQHLAAFGG